MTLPTASLRALAQAATPGPWRNYKNCLYGQVVTDDGKQVTMNEEHGACWHDDAEYIAAANPAVILALLSRLDRQERAIAIIDQHFMPMSIPYPWVKAALAEARAALADEGDG